MIQVSSLDRNKEVLRQLRLRMGWCTSDLARRLQCSVTDVKMWEEGSREINSDVLHEIEILVKQADSYNQEVRCVPIAENQCDLYSLDQIEFDRVKAELE